MSKKRKERPLLERVADDGSSKFARALGSVDYHTRERGLQALTLWLSRRSDVGELELLRLWKGIFYCFWHSDKAPVQAALAERLSEMILQLPDQVALLYFTVFLRTLRREWFGIDHLRLDKFLLLIRKFMHQLLRLLQAGGWASDQVWAYGELWLHEVLLPQHNLAAAGLAYHICDLLVPELAAVCSGGGDVPQPATLAALLEPFCQALACTRDPALVYRLRRGVFDPLLDQLRAQPPHAPWHILDVDTLATHVFDLGAREETRAKNREALYSISAALEKAAKQCQRSASAGGQQSNRHAPQQPSTAAADAALQPKKGKKKRSAEDAAASTPVLAELDAHQGGAAAAAERPHADEAAAPTASVRSQNKKKAKLASASAGRGSAQQGATAELPPKQQPVSAKKQLAKTPAARGQLSSGGNAAPLQPAGAEASPAVHEATTAGKKNVRFSLRRNLVMTIGQPPLPEDVRTPPTSKPKGSALKAVSSVKAPRSAPARLNNAKHGGQARSKLAGGSKSASKAGGVAAAWQQRGGAGAKRVLSLLSPDSLPRKQASEFF